MIWQYKRKTNETNIEIRIGKSEEWESFVDTGIGFFDHMLLTFLRYSNLNGEIRVSGDIYVDGHHTIEDTGIALGKVIFQMIENKSIKRYASSIIPMDDALVRSVIDIGGRPFMDFNYDFKRDRLGDYETEMTKEFLRAFAMNSLSTIHVDVLKGENEHHITEAIYKSLGLCIGEGIEDLNSQDIFSLKGRVEE